MKELRIGFIGAGKCGMSLAHYFKEKGYNISGFASNRPEQEFPFYQKPELVENSDIIFITVNDSAIADVWNEIKSLDLSEKTVCHTSGAETSEILCGAARAASVHPMLAFSSRFTPAEHISEAFFTIEGAPSAVAVVSEILSDCGNRFKIISREHKVLYHAAACFASNFVVSVCEKAERYLVACGFTKDEAHSALVPLMKNNMEAITEKGTKAAVTGPAARGDMRTIEKHRAVLGTDAALYDLLTNVILDMTGK